VNLTDGDGKTALHHFVGRISSIKDRMRVIKAINGDMLQAFDADLFQQLVRAGGDLQAVVEQHRDSVQVIMDKSNLAWSRDRLKV
jgi:hypothetical protein